MASPNGSQPQLPDVFIVGAVSLLERSQLFRDAQEVSDNMIIVPDTHRRVQWRPQKRQSPGIGRHSCESSHGSSECQARPN